MTTQAPHPSALTAAGKRLADALVKAMVIPPSNADPARASRSNLITLNAAAEILMPAEGAGLREAAQMFVSHYPHGINPFLDRAHTLASAALASPQSAVEGPVAAGVVPGGKWKEGCCSAISPCPHQQRDKTTLCDVCERASCIRPKATLTPPADPKPTVTGNDAGLREAHRAGYYAWAAPASGKDVMRDEEAERQSWVEYSASLTPQTGSAGEAPKTPDAGAGGDTDRLTSADQLRIAACYHRDKLPAGLADELLSLADEWSEEVDTLRSAQPAPVGEDETGMREACGQAIYDRQRKKLPDQESVNASRPWRSDDVPNIFWDGYCEDASAVLGVIKLLPVSSANIIHIQNLQSIKRRQDAAGICTKALDAAIAALANQPPKAETPAGVGEIAREFLKRWDRFLASDKNHECAHRFLVDGGGWEAWEALRAALSAAPAARPGDGVEREALALITDEAARYTCFRSGCPQASDSSTLTVSVPLGLARQLDASLPRAPAAAPAADGGRA